MKNISVISLLAIVIVLVGISGCIDNNQNTNSTNYQTSGQNIVVNDTQNTTANISAEEARKTAAKYIEEPGATAGEPVLINTDGKSTYIVPVILNGNQVGEILIDAQTGENIGGAGGVSNKVE